MLSWLHRQRWSVVAVCLCRSLYDASGSWQRLRLYTALLLTRVHLLRNQSLIRVHARSDQFVQRLVLWDWNSPIQEVECWLKEQQASISLPRCPWSFKRHAVVLWLLLLVVRNAVFLHHACSGCFLEIQTHGSKILIALSAWLKRISRVLAWNLSLCYFGFGVG